MKKAVNSISMIRRAVCILANKLHGAGMAMSEAFKKAWHRVRETTFRVAGVMADNRQGRISYLRQFPLDDLQAGLRREENNPYDSNAIQILIRIKSLNKYAVMGYIPRVIAEQIAPLMDRGVKFGANLLQITGGYSYKENLGLLVSVAV